MSKPTPRGFWSYIAQKLLNKGKLSEQAGFAKARDVKRAADEVQKLRQHVFETYPWKDVEAPSAPAGGEGELYMEAWKMGRNKQHAAALKLLEQNTGSVKELAELRIMQAAIAYHKRWDGDVVAFLEAAVDATKPERSTLYWGPTPIVSNSYWSRAMNSGGLASKTLMWNVASINRREDFDLLVEEVMPSWLVFKDSTEMFSYGKLPHMLGFLHLVRHASVVHVPVTGYLLGMLRIWKEETRLLKRAGIKLVLLPYGGDYYCYSRVQDPCVRYGLLANYPELARNETETQARLTHWQQEADCVIPGYMVDAMGRFDVPVFTPFHIDTDMWSPPKEYSAHDGKSGPVSVMHTPNHRGFKGTEFLLHAVEELRTEGLNIDLRLLEGVPNSEVRRLMGESDILAEQFIATGYAMSGMEGMACGLPVMANLDSEYYTRIYRRYSYLNECPILSTTPESLKENLRALVTRPKLREELGRAGREYMVKYHSYPAARHLFGNVYDRMLHGKDVDLINLFHPVTSESARTRPPVKHPLVENRLPETLKGR